uniref:RING-type E3 ubiquitin transferase n=1 Tax=Oryza nivara TaxID=4536 RepID=A0A0E0I6I2_ORYNI
MAGWRAGLSGGAGRAHHANLTRGPSASSPNARLRRLISRDDLAEAARLVDRSRGEAPDAAAAAAAKTNAGEVREPKHRAHIAVDGVEVVSRLIGRYYDGLALELVLFSLAVVVLRYATVLYANHLVDSLSEFQAAVSAGIGGGGGLSSGGGLDSAAIARLPCFVLPPRRGGSAAAAVTAECAVCLGTVEELETVRALPCCPHAFHAHCVDAWLRQRPTCPLCRADVPVMARPTSSTIANGKQQQTADDAFLLIRPRCRPLHFHPLRALNAGLSRVVAAGGAAPYPPPPPPTPTTRPAPRAAADDKAEWRGVVGAASPHLPPLSHPPTPPLRSGARPVAWRRERERGEGERRGDGDDVAN